MSSDRLELIRSVLQSEIDQGRIPGAVVAIARRGRVVFHEALGFRDKAAGIAMTKDVIFPIASMTKPILAVGALILQEEGRLAVSEPVARYIPELDSMAVAVAEEGSNTNAGSEPARRQPTIQDLMRHTSGFITPPGGASRTTQQVLDTLRALPLLHQPGTEWRYQGGFDVLGILIERVTQNTLGEFLDARVFEPLGMVDTGFLVPSSDAHRYVVALPTDPITGNPQSIADRRQPIPFQCGGGCLASTANDYLRFAQMLVNHGSLGQVRILGPKSVEYMVSDHIGEEVDLSRLAAGWPLDEGYGFGLGVAVRRGNGISSMMGTAGDYHWGGAAGTYFWVDPQEELAVVFLAAAPGTLRIRYRHLMQALVLQAIVD